MSLRQDVGFTSGLSEQTTYILKPATELLEEAIRKQASPSKIVNYAKQNLSNFGQAWDNAERARQLTRSHGTQ
eukprot:4268701-Amphidinium_carterae.1